MKVPCQTCADNLRPGLLWLGGNDYVECPDCLETKEVEVIAERFSPRERLVSIIGLRSHIERSFHPSIAHLQEI